MLEEEIQINMNMIDLAIWNKIYVKMEFTWTWVLNENSQDKFKFNNVPLIWNLFIF